MNMNVAKVNVVALGFIAAACIDVMASDRTNGPARAEVRKEAPSKAGPAPRARLATQKLAPRPWERPSRKAEVARSKEETLYFYW